MTPTWGQACHGEALCVQCSPTMPFTSWSHREIDVLGSSGPCDAFLKGTMEEGVAQTPRPSPAAPALRLIIQMPTGLPLQGPLRKLSVLSGEPTRCIRAPRFPPKYMPQMGPSPNSVKSTPGSRLGRAPLVNSTCQLRASSDVLSTACR